MRFLYLVSVFFYLKVHLTTNHTSKIMNKKAIQPSCHVSCISHYTLPTWRDKIRRQTVNIFPASIRKHLFLDQFLTFEALSMNNCLKVEKTHDHCLYIIQHFHSCGSISICSYFKPLQPLQQAFGLPRHTTLAARAQPP